MRSINKKEGNMKQLAVLMMVLMWVTLAQAEKVSVSKTYEDTTGVYIVTFQYNDSWCTRPLTFPIGFPHYDAEITVRMCCESKLAQIGEPFKGIFTDGKCYEDNLPDLIVSDLIVRAKESLLSKVSQSSTNTNTIVIITDHNATISRPPKGDIEINTNNIFAVTNWSKFIAPHAITNAVNDLAESGDICRVKGHCWDEGQQGRSCDQFLTDYCNNIKRRTCTICGKREIKTESDWK